VPVEAQQTLHLDDIGQIALTVRDLATSKDFFQNTLGMTFLFDAGTMAFFQCGSVRLMISTAESPGPVGGTILYFRTADIHTAHSLLKERGVNFLQEPHLVARMPTHDLWMAFLKDPDDNTFGLMSEVARADAPPK
jgi:methylmalonyl-CoA/ethylmalonyl-CoA epimerase